MALYIRDPEVGQLADRLAAHNGLNKTEAVRRALLHELQREQALPSLVERGLAFARAVKLRGDPAKAQTMTKGEIDALYEDE